MEKLINYDNGNFQIIPTEYNTKQDLVKFTEALHKAQDIFQFEIMLNLYHLEGFLSVPIRVKYTTDEQLEKDLEIIKDIIDNQISDDIKPKGKFKLVFNIYPNKEDCSIKTQMSITFNNKKLKEKK